MGFFGNKKGADYNDYDDGFVDVTSEETGASDAQVNEPVSETAQEKTTVGISNHTFSGTEIGAAASLELKVMRPERYEDASDIADQLLSGRTVVLNMDFISKDVSRRLIDFLSGVAYSIGGQFQRVANGTFIITPRNVEVSEAGRGESTDDESDADAAVTDIR